MTPLPHRMTRGIVGCKKIHRGFTTVYCDADPQPQGT
jgi:hypothetical protein